MLQFLLCWFLDALFPFSMLQIPLSFKFLRVASLFDLVLKLPKPDYPECQIGLSGFPRLAKFVHQQYPSS
jgi:hypothetical protein